MFYVGQKVVCVDAHYTNELHIPELVEGNIYTLSWVGSGDEPLVRLAERVFRNRCGNDDPFAAKRFRPVIHTDISIFTAMLNKQPDGVDA